MSTPKGTPVVKKPSRPQAAVISQKEWEQYKEDNSYLDKIVKSHKTTKPISLYNEINAMIRISEIQRALEAIQKEVAEDARKELILNFFHNYGHVPELLEQPKISPLYKQKKDYLAVDTIHVFRNCEKSDLNHISKYRDGKHIIIAVDLSIKRQDIIKGFNQVLTRIGKNYEIPKDNTRNSHTLQDIWKVYDYHKKDKLNFVQIARRVSGEKGNSTYNTRLESRVKQVRRAYKKAEEIINHAGKRIKKQKGRISRST